MTTLIFIALIVLIIYSLYERGERIKAETKAEEYYFDLMNRPRPIVMSCGNDPNNCSCNPKEKAPTFQCTTGCIEHAPELIESTVPYYQCKKCYQNLGPAYTKISS
jgi:hypothetical protein